MQKAAYFKAWERIIVSECIDKVKQYNKKEDGNVSL